MRVTLMMTAALVTASPLFAQTSNDPFPSPIPATDGVIRVDFVEFASIPDVDGSPARMMRLVDEPGTGRIFVNDMRGPIYSVSYDGRTVAEYVDIDDPSWEVAVQSRGRERGFQSFAFHPQFGQPGTPGFGKFYAWTDSDNTGPAPDFTPSGDGDAHDTVLLEWTARTPRGHHLRRRPAAGGPTGSTTVREPQRRSDRIRSASLARRGRLRSALRLDCRRRQRRRPAQPCTKPGLSLREAISNRPLRLE